MIIQAADALSAEDCRRLMTMYDRHVHLTTVRDQTGNPVVKPRRGLLLAFPSDADHVHEILPVRSGARYTMAIWFTKQQRLALSISALRAPESRPTPRSTDEG